MVRTQIYLPKDDHASLRKLARELNSSLSDLLREGAKLVMKKHNTKLTAQQEASRYFANPNKKGRLTLTGAELITQIRKDRDS